MSENKFGNSAEDSELVLGQAQTLFESLELFGEENVFLPSSPVVAKVSLPNLDELIKKYQNCQNCELARFRQRIVFGQGSVSPKVLFIGEGPGYEEDRTGLPFVGKAGQLLDNILKAIGLDRANVYIANIVKCHPMKDPEHPDNRGNDRPPDEKEIAACREILLEQIRILQPPLICSLGATASKALLETTEGITRLRGKVFQTVWPGLKGTRPLLPTYHPAALLRNPDLKKDVWEDMKLLKKLIDQQIAF